MNKEKLAIFIELIDKAIQTAESHREVMQTPEFYQKCKELGWITDEDIHLGREHIEKKCGFDFQYQLLEKNIIGGLKRVKEKAENYEKYYDFWDRVREQPKGYRGNFGWSHGISEYICLWGDCLYEDRIYNACGAVEDYYNRELE